uniref:Bifunctional lycopene cyclase/phytoene synthase n=1 Tax=Clastoptera arizonana TaxID=38151 RepID=A0A1B6CT17_9HEMI
MDSVVLFDKTCTECSEVITRSYSTSFSLGISLLNKKYSTAIYSLYGYLRFADEIVDTFVDEDRKYLLDKFKKDTYEAIETKISTNPVLHSFQLVVHRHGIGRDLIDAFLHSMTMDLELKAFDETQYKEYIYGSAGVVGLMCLRVFCEGDEEMYQHLKLPASKLGSAFQKVNFLRDMKSDYEERGRVYFPGVDFVRFDESSKKMIERDIEEDFNVGHEGINKLPEGARSGVRLAYIYYNKLFQRIKRLPPQSITQKRIRISNFQKCLILLSEKCLYLVLNILIISCPFLCSFESRINYVSKWYALFPSIFLSAVFFIIWDVVFTKMKVWKFNSRYLIGYKFLGLPVEEWLFFFTVPYSCVFIYESLNYLFPQNILQPLAKPFFYFLIPGIIGMGLIGSDKVYTWVNSLLAVAMILTHLFMFGERFLGKFLMALMVHYVPFTVCNGILCGGISLEEPVVLYNKQAILNYRIVKNIPVEDTIYSMTLLLMNVSLFEWFQT